MRLLFPIIIFLISVLHAEFPWLRIGLGGSLIGNQYAVLENDTTVMTTEGKFLLDANYSRDIGNHNIRGEIFSDIGDRSTWLQLYARWKLRAGEFAAEASEMLETRAPYSGIDDITGYARQKFNMSLSQKFGPRKLTARVWVDGKQYHDESEYYYNYNLLRSMLSYALPLIGTDAEISWSYSFRSVPDSTQANYDRRQIQLSISKLWRNGNWSDLWIEYDREYFPSESQSGSYNSLWSSSQLSIMMDAFTLEPSVELEWRNYDAQDDVFFTYLWLEGGAKVGRDIAGWNIAIGPNAAVQNADEQYSNESYIDAGLELSADNLSYGKFWLFLTVEPGRRFYSESHDAESAISDYTFIDLSLFSSIWILKNLRADISASYFPEIHTKPGDDIAISYVSLAVRYEFY